MAEQQEAIDRFFIQVQDGQGNWQDVSVREASHQQFHEWARLWFFERLGRWLDVGPLESSADERAQVLGLIEELQREGGQGNG